MRFAKVIRVCDPGVPLVGGEKCAVECRADEEARRRIRVGRPPEAAQGTLLLQVTGHEANRPLGSVPA